MSPGRPRAFEHGAASHAVLTVFAQSMMGTVEPAYPAKGVILENQPSDAMGALYMPIDFRPAQASDAHDIARFFQLTSEGMADYIWSKLAAPGEALLSVGASRYAREQGDFSYKNCLMATFEGSVIGMMHSYVLRETPDRPVETDPVLAPYSDMEIPDTLYISSLALDEAWRSQGLGAQFLRHAQQRAEDSGLDGLCLIDYAENHGARRFYERHGFQIVKTCQIVPHPMLGVTGEAYLMYRPTHNVLEKQP